MIAFNLIKSSKENLPVELEAVHFNRLNVASFWIIRLFKGICTNFCLAKLLNLHLHRKLWLHILQLVQMDSIQSQHTKFKWGLITCIDCNFLYWVVFVGEAAACNCNHEKLLTLKLVLFLQYQLNKPKHSVLTDALMLHKIDKFC